MFDIDTIETPSLGDRSYLISDGAVAAVIDPQRDIDRLLERANGTPITHVFETHLHNDYVTGGLALAETTGAAYVIAADDVVHFDRVPVRDGDVVTVGTMRFRVIDTPGHTHHHVSYALQDASGTTHAVFTGGSMLYGATGRTDLVGADATDALTHAQFHSVRRLAAELPTTAQVFPTHGFGSFCSATPTTGTQSTIGEQQHSNPALTHDEQTFVDELIAGLSAFPAYYSHMMPLNMSGPRAVDLSMPTLVEPSDLRRRIESGEWVVDLRNRRAFAAGHLAGSRSFELSDNFVTYVGWLHPWDAPLTLLGDSEDQILDARRDLARIGVDRVDGAAIATRHDGERSYPVADFSDLARVMAVRPVQILDTRRDDERAESAIPGSAHIPIHELPDRLGEAPNGEVWVHCATGYRAGIAASMLDTDGRRVIHLDDTFDHASDLGLTVAAADANVDSNANVDVRG